MPKNRKLNLARLLYDAYPDRDLLPLEPRRDCRSLRALHEKVTTEDIGDTLFEFLVVEMVEGGEQSLDDAIRVVARARNDLEAVLRALVERKGETEAKSRLRGRKGQTPRTDATSAGSPLPPGRRPCKG